MLRISEQLVTIDSRIRTLEEQHPKRHLRVGAGAEAGAGAGAGAAPAAAAAAEGAS